MTSKITVWFIIALSLIGFFTLLFMTKSGIGTSPDSVTYIGVARNLLEGKGVSVPFGRVIDSPLTQHPPLYPIVLALIGFLGIDPLTGARWLNIFLFGTLILFVGLSIKYHTSNSIWMPVFGSFLVLTSAVTLGIHSFAWTEPLFILLVFGGLALLAAYLDNSKWVFLVSASFLIGMATLTRYVGVAVIAAGFLGIMLLQDGKFLKKFRDAIFFGLISFLPIIIWLMRNSLSTNSVTSRDIIFHPITVSQLLQALHTISTWLLIPVATPGLIKVLIWLIIFVGNSFDFLLSTKKFKIAKSKPAE